MKELKLFNGRAYCCHNRNDPRWQEIRPDAAHAYAAAYSAEDCRRLIAEYVGYPPSANEIKTYWSKCWGIHMDGITPERGLWIQFDRTEKPVRVV